MDTKEPGLTRQQTRARPTAHDPGGVPQGRPVMILLSILAGAISGLGAVLFRDLISFVHNLSFLGTLSFTYNANEHTAAGPWGLLTALVPVAGAAGVTFLVTRFAPEAKGHGVPEVMDSVYHGNGIIRPIVALIKSLASALCIGTGGSVGREGPIVQIGSSFGSMIGQFLPMSQKQRITLLAAGAAGGIAATFNTPIGGILFAVELILNEVSTATLVPVAICTVTATYVSRFFFGVHPSFVIPTLTGPYSTLESPGVLLSYAVLGVLMGAASALFVSVIYRAEDLFTQRSFRSPYLRHMSAMLVLGVMFVLFLRLTGNYAIEGVGYSTVQDILRGSVRSLPLLLLLFFAKIAATSITLGSGGSGGVFSPSLFLGATGGGAYGLVLLTIFPALGVRPEAFAVAGMAGLVGGSTGAALTAIVMIFEMTLDYSAIVPIAITVAFSYAVRKALLRESIYTMKLTRRGLTVPDAIRVSFLSLRTVAQIMTRRVIAVPSSSSLARLLRTARANPDSLWMVVAEKGFVVGVISRNDVHEEASLGRYRRGFSKDLMRAFSRATPNETVFDAAARMRSEGTLAALVSDSRLPSLKAVDVVGILGRENLGDIIDDYVGFYSDRQG
jgi:chloride channel protein, CIC family